MYKSMEVRYVDIIWSWSNHICRTQYGLDISKQKRQVV